MRNKGSTKPGFILAAEFPHGCVPWGCAEVHEAACEGRTCYPRLPELRPKIDLSVCICLCSHRPHAPRRHRQRKLLAYCCLGCAWVLWYLFLHSLRVFQFILLWLLLPQFFRPNNMLINDELPVTNHCLLFPAMPLFVSFTSQKQLNQWKIEIYIKKIFFCGGRFWKGHNLLFFKGSFILSPVTTYLGSHFSYAGYLLLSWKDLKPQLSLSAYKHYIARMSSLDQSERL